MKMQTFAAVVAALSISHAQALDLQVKDKQFDPGHIGFAPDGARACLAGSSFDPDVAQNSGELMVVDYKRNALLWKKHIPAPEDSVALKAAQCTFSGDHVYVLANVNTQSSQTLNQTLVYLYQFDADGKQVGFKELGVPGRNKFGYAIGPSASGVQVAGYIKDDDKDFEYYSLFTIPVDKRLTEGKANIRKTGAFGSSAAARFVGENLHIADKFMPAKLSKNDLPSDYAHSRVLANGGYAWSLRPYKKEVRNVKSAISAQGAIYSLADDYGTSMLGVTSAEGKQLSLASYESKFCKTRSIAEFGSAVIAVRQPCSGKGKAELLSIAPATGKENPVVLAQGEPVFVTTNDGNWFLVTKDGKGRMALDVGAIKE